MTATATVSTVNSIIDHLGVPKNEMEEAVLQNTVLPDNLLLTVSEDDNKDVALVQLLKQPPFSEFDSIIIYCLRRNECERLASFLRTSLEVSNLKKNFFLISSTVPSINYRIPSNVKILEVYAFFFKF